MASISRDGGGRRTIQFVAADGKRKSIRLGKISQRIAEEVRIKVEILNSITIARSPMDNETARWVSGLSETLADKLAAVALIPKRDTARLGEFIDHYIVARTDVKPNSRKNFEATKARLLEFFAPATNLRDISPGDADVWLVSLRTAYSGASIALFVKRARQFFRSALRQKLIPENPFAELKIPSDANKAREFFVTRENAQSVLAACPDAEWRLIFALSRFGGLRCPSEHLALQWGDVDWERDRLLVHASKTEHLESGGDRWIPLFPELRRHLEEAFDLADEGAVYVITRCREAKVNLRTQLLRIIKRAGLMPWPRLFHSLRASRQTELAAEFPLHVVCSWIGNSVRIASKHYLQVTDADFQRAAKPGALALQNAVQQPAAHFRAASQDRTESEGSGGVVLIGASGCEEGQYPRQESNL